VRAQIADVTWDGAIADLQTRFPIGFDPVAHGVKLEKPEKPEE